MVFEPGTPGWCLVPNPFNPNQVSRVPLSPAEVEAFVFWSRNPRPLMRYLDELDDLGCRYYFFIHFDRLPGPDRPRNPAASLSIKTFQELSARVGPQRVIWRYDPIVLSCQSGTCFHERNFRQMARSCKEATGRCVISFCQTLSKSSHPNGDCGAGQPRARRFCQPADSRSVDSNFRNCQRKQNGNILLRLGARFLSIRHKSVKVHRRRTCCRSCSESR